MRLGMRNMASIQMDGEDKTTKISDWAIRWSDKDEFLELTCHYPSKKNTPARSVIAWFRPPAS